MTAPVSPTLLAVAHGTRDPDGIAEVGRLVELVRRARPDLDVRLCWLELAEPLLADALADCPGPVVVVPLLLSTGFHVKTDIAAAVADRPDAAAAAQLGPDPRIATALLDRIREVGEPPAAGIALFSAGSSDPQAADNLAEAAVQLQQLAGCPVHPRVLTDPHWRDGLPLGVVVAGYLLAPGFFADRLAALARTGPDPRPAAAPLGAHPAVAEVVLDRYREAVLRVPS